jgi:hypothetical protein
MKTSLLASACIVFLARAACAEFVMPTAAPVERLVKNTEAKLAKRPGDVETIYQLARVHYLAFSLKSYDLGVYDGNAAKATGEDVAPKDFQIVGAGKRLTGKLPTADAITHAAKAADLFQQAIGKDPNHALSHLGLASLLDQFSTEAAGNPPKEIPPALAKHDGVTIRKHFARAFELAWKKDQTATQRGLRGLADFISHEAATAYIRSTAADEARLTAEERKNVGEMKAAVAKLDALPFGPITPLVFSFRPAGSLGALLAPEVSADFDLRGFGEKERWPWLRSDTALLVWDPAHTGRITSARQLFGGYSWQIFWRDGFDALAALDDNQDGWLRGSELNGLAAWFDRNQDGVSDPGEVVPLSSLGITGLACSATAHDGPHLLRPAGVELRDGRKLPLWDWVTSPLPPAPRGFATATSSAARN